MARPKKITDDVGAKVVGNPTAEQIAETVSAERVSTGQDYAAALHDYVATKQHIDIGLLDPVKKVSLISPTNEQMILGSLVNALASNPEVYKGTAADAAKIVRLARQIMAEIEAP